MPPVEPGGLELGGTGKAEAYKQQTANITAVAIIGKQHGIAHIQQIPKALRGPENVNGRHADNRRQIQFQRHTVEPPRPNFLPAGLAARSHAQVHRQHRKEQQAASQHPGAKGLPLPDELENVRRLLLPVQLSRAVIQPQGHGVGFLHRNFPNFVDILLVLQTHAQNLVAVFQSGGVIILDDVHHVEKAFLGGLLPPEGQDLIGLCPHLRCQRACQDFGVGAASLGDLEGLFGGGILRVLLLLKKLALGIPDFIIYVPVVVLVYAVVMG